MRRAIILLLLALCSPYARGQDSIPARLSFHDYLERVFQRHPRVRQADLQADQGQAILRSARGFFDPLVKSSFNKKNYSDSEYYRINDNSIVLPTWFGIEMKAGYEQNSGGYLNPEQVLPSGGLAYAGISLPLLQGLVIDERRSALRQAEALNDAAMAERELLLNDLFFESSAIYWDWFSSWNALRVFQNAVELAEFRRQAVVSAYEQGDLPAIDTLEALIQVQNFLLSRNDALVKFLKARFDLSFYLWPESPDSMATDSLKLPLSYEYMGDFGIAESALRDDLLMTLDELHPELRWYRFKLEQLDVDRRWKAEKIKPLLNFNYNALSEPVTGNPIEGFNSQNYKWGLDFKFPLLLRNERGNLQLARIKLEQVDLDLQQKTIELRNKVGAYYAEIENLAYQIELYRNTVQNLAGLLHGERRRFQEGESSLFLVNSREITLISAEVRLIDLLARYQKAAAGLLWSSGSSLAYMQQIIPEM